MNAKLFVREPNTAKYSELGTRTFLVLPRTDEYISAASNGEKKYFQVVAIHHAAEDGSIVEIYAVRSEPAWQEKNGRTIGFGQAGK